VYHRSLLILALLTAIATFPLIFMGGLVTSHGAGMSVPDWPNSYGYNMFAFPFSQWLGPDKGGIFYEHLHRLMGTVVGLLAIAVAIVAWLVEKRRWVRWLAVGVLGAVILQGVLGGLRVVLVNVNIAVVHACFAQAFFCLATMLTMVTSRWWLERDPIHVDRQRRLPVMGAIATCVVYVQLILGALMRHYERQLGGGLAIPDLPWAYGKLLPPTDATGLDAANRYRAFELHMDPVPSLMQMWVHFGHRVWAIVVTIAILTIVTLIWRRYRQERSLFVTSIGLVVLLVTQLTLGVYTILLRKPADIATLHVACGALVLVTTFVLTLQAVRLYWPRPVGQVAAASRQQATRPMEYATA